MEQAGGDDDVIAMASVDFTEAFSQELAKCWETMVSVSEVELFMCIVDLD